MAIDSRLRVDRRGDGRVGISDWLFQKTFFAQQNYGYGLDDDGRVFPERHAVDVMSVVAPSIRPT